MVLAPKRPPKTYDDYLAVPDGERAELIGGELMMSPQPKGRHIRVASLLGGRLVVSFGTTEGPSTDGPGGWWILYEPEVHLRLDEAVVVPDLAGWRRERMPEPPSDTHKFTVVPDWVCEVLSPSTASRDSIVKMPLYREAGVEWAWIIDPVSHRVDVFRSVDGRWEPVVSAEGPATAALRPFDAVTLNLAPWWGP